MNPAQLKAAAIKAVDEGRFPDGAHLYTLAAQASDDEQFASEATQSAYDHAQLHATLQSAQRWLTINPTSQQAHELAALAAVRLYQVDAAYEHLNELLRAAYITPASGFLQLLPKLADADASAALATLQRLLLQYPNVAEAHYVVAKLAAQTANQALMQRAAQRAHELSPFWSPAGMERARAELSADHTEKAVAIAQDVVKNDNSVATRTDYAEILLLAGHTQEALKLLQELEQSDSDASPAIRLLAQLDFQAGSYQAAFNRFSRLLNIGKNVSESIFYLAQIADRTGAADEARQLYARVQDGEYAITAQVRLARLIQAQEGIDAALASLQQYGDAKPDDLLATVVARAELLGATGDNVGALALYDQSLRSFPDVASLKLSRAFLLVKMDKLNPALLALRGLVAERPQDPIMLNALGYTLVDRAMQIHQGRDYIATALQSSPDSGAVLDSMGWAEFKLGHAQAALGYLQRAAGRTIDPDLDFHLGEVLWSLKRRDDAVQVWRVGLTHAPDHVQLKQRLQRATKLIKTIKPITATPVD